MTNPITEKSLDEKLDEKLDLFGHAVINYGQQEGSRTKLKSKYANQIMSLIHSYTENAVREAEESGKTSTTYMVVGQDGVTKWLDEGWELYGNPMLGTNSNFAYQAIVKRARLTQNSKEEK